MTKSADDRYWAERETQKRRLLDEATARGESVAGLMERAWHGDRRYPSHV